MKLTMLAVHAGSPGFDSQCHRKAGAAGPAKDQGASRLSSSEQPVQGQPGLFDPPTPSHTLKKDLRPGSTLRRHGKSTSTGFSLVLFKAGFGCCHTSVQKPRPRRLMVSAAIKHPAAPTSCSQRPTYVQMALPVTTKPGKVDLRTPTAVQ